MIRPHSESWWLQAETGDQDKDAVIEEGQTLFEAGIQAPASGGPSDGAAARKVLAATLSFAPGCSVMAARLGRLGIRVGGEITLQRGEHVDP